MPNAGDWIPGRQGRLCDATRVLTGFLLLYCKQTISYIEKLPENKQKKVAGEPATEFREETHNKYCAMQDMSFMLVFVKAIQI
jgi:hypothetical protein